MTQKKRKRRAEAPAVAAKAESRKGEGAGKEVAAVRSQQHSIDAIFEESLKKKRKISSEEASDNVSVKKSSGKKRKTKKPATIEEDLGLTEYDRKVTEEGFKVYSLDELNIGRGGGTALCPFDCDCCN
eukprot:GHVU01143594.1.p2 GENE.GHVU01143594.1~~GHVU01143594.1.p2  ORF type:complete len:128 (-),score=27.69 GHVU01143594.1:537-920(-)